MISAGAGAGALAFGPSLFKRAMTAAAAAQVGPGPYGTLLDPDANGVRVPSGFTSRVIARGSAPVQGTGYTMPIFPDGASTFATPDGGWILAVNSEVPGSGGASGIRFDKSGAVTDAYRILEGTSTNCAGGGSPWGTWLSAEEVDYGYIWECDTTGSTAPVRRDALGRFKHEAACVDPVEGRLYLTEDIGDGGFYRFTPTAYPDLSAGKLEIATVATGGAVTWTAVPNPIPGDGEAPTRAQVPGSTKFDRGEGIWYDAGVVYVATTNDETVHAYDVAKRAISILYRQAETPDSPLKGVDNVTVSRSGDVYVCEDSYDNDPDAMDVCIITREGEVARFVKLTGAEHFLPGIAQSEITGVCFSPNGQRMYFGSQRAGGPGALYEVSGPFRLDRPGGAVVSNASAVVGSAIGVEVAPKAAISLLTGAGLPIALTLDSPTKVKAKLLEAKPKGGAKPKVIAKGSAQLGRGRGQLNLKVKGRKPRQELRQRRRTLNAVLEVKVGGAKTRRKIKLTV